MYVETYKWYAGYLTSPIDPAVYPYNLYSIYPAQSLLINDARHLLEVEMKTKYPGFNICETGKSCSSV